MRTRKVKEGRVNLVIPDNVFYNPLAKFSRSIGIPIVKHESHIKGRDLILIDLLAASGVRGIRYYIESGALDKAVFNDRSPNAYKTILDNIRINNIERYEVYKYDANLFLSLYNEETPDFIDIDPFGSPSSFIESAIRNLKNKGILAVTATDLTALCGIYPRSAFRKYGSIVRKTPFCHEIALRTLIKLIVEAAGRHLKYAVPILSYFTEQYARVYTRIIRGKKKFPYKQIGFLCIEEDKIEEINIEEIKSINLGSMIGPLWLGPLHNKTFIKGLLDRKYSELIGDKADAKRAEKYFNIFIDEAEMPPYYYDIHKLTKKLKISPPPLEAIIEELTSLGFRVSRTHFVGYGIKTDSPLKTLLEVLIELGR
jgi:tRNA (guanine26-N2/guanine27-N2)-dimethyltransferase